MGIPSSYHACMKFPGTREQISQACLEAVRQSGFRIRRSDLAAGRVTARARISTRSWGENIQVYLDSEDQVDITSKCRYPITIIDWGKNRWNVERIFSHLTALLGAGFPPIDAY